MLRPKQRNIGELLNLHRDYVLSKVSNVRILGDADERELKDVFIELTVVDQHAPQQHAEFLGMMDAAMRRRLDPFLSQTGDGSPQPRRQHDTKRSVKPDELLRRRTKAIVTGAPGSGKTTLLKYLALQAQEKENRLVVWLELKAIGKPLFGQAERAAAHDGSLILEELWIRHLKAQLSLSDAEMKLLREHWQEKFKAGEISLLLDGFDELQGEGIEPQVNKCVSEFGSAFYDNTILISTRPYALRKLGNERLQEFEIEPLNQSQIEAFLNCYYPNDAATTGLLKTLRERASLRELLTAPLLLGIVLRLHRENKLTDERLKLYEVIISALVHELDRSKSISRFKIDDGRLRLCFLEFLAFERLLCDDLDNEEPEANRIVFNYELLKEKAKIFLTRERSSHKSRHLADDALATPLLREIGTDVFAFAHLTLQEYLAAREFAAFHKSNEFEGLRMFCRAYHNPTIVEMEILPMMLGASSKASTLYDELERLPESLRFANFRLRTRGLVYGAKISQEHLSKIIELFASFLFESRVESKPYFEVMAKSLAGCPQVYLAPIAEHLKQFLTPQQFDYTRAKTTDTLGRIGGERSNELLQIVLKDKAEYVRQKAAYWLGELGYGSSSSALIAALNDEAEEVVKAAARALVNVSIEQSIPSFIDALRSGNATSRSIAIFWLGILGRENTLDVIEGVLANEEAPVRLKALETLGFIGGERALSMLCDFRICTTSVTAIGQCGGERAIEVLLAALQDPIGHVRSAVIDALVKIDGQRFIEVFIHRLHDPDPFVRQHAAMALDLVPDRQAIPALLVALDYKSHLDIASSHRGLVVGAVARALRHFRDEQVFQALVRLLEEDKGGEGAGSAAIALASIGDARAVGPLLQALGESSNYVQAWAAEALGLLGDIRATLPLVKALQDGDDILQMRAAEALGRIKDERGVEALLVALQSESTSEEAALALRFFEGKAFAEELAKALSHENKFVRRKAVSYVAYYSLDRNLLEQISRLAEADVDEFVRRAATEVHETFTHKLEVLGCVVASCTMQELIDNESRTGVLVHEVGKIIFEAGHIFRPTTNNDWGIDGEIEFKNNEGKPSGERVYLQLKSGDSHLRKRKRDGKEIFRVKPRHSKYWQSHAYPVLLVIRDSSGRIRWMNVTEYLRRQGANVKQIEFQGEPFTAASVKRMCATSFG